MNFRRIIAVFCALISITIAFGFVGRDDDPIKKIIAQLNKWADKTPAEKVYLHLDKPYYAVGDDIWFKAYVTIGGIHQLSALSNILTVELINDKDSVKQAVKLPVMNGLAVGDFALADTLKEGNYRIRAYTNYMRNAGEAYFFDKTIVIANAVNNNVFTKTSYTYNTQNGQQKVNALINYADLNGVAYAGKEVNYEVQLDFRTVAKGKGITDDKGNLNVTFTNAMPNLLKSGKIITRLKVADKRFFTKEVIIKATSAGVNVQFFPESGNLVYGVRSKVAFKAVGADGLGADVTGVVVDNDNKEVAHFSSQHGGMGVFSMLAEAGKTYKATITNPDGTQSNTDLPKAIDKGFVLSINNTDPDNLFIKILPSRALLDDLQQNGEISLVAHAGGIICYAAKSKITTGSFMATVPKSKFPTGIIDFTLFSASGEPLNERLVFIQNNDQLKLNIASDKQSYSPRQKAKLNLTAKDKDGKPVVGSFSVAVLDETKVPVDETAESTIMSNLLLTSDIKGYIEKPNYYFTDINDKTRADLDVLMLTQGYRRFEWRQVLNDVFPPLVFLPEKSLSVSGTIKTSGGKPVAKGKVTMLTTAGGMFILDTVTDSQGRFAFNNMVFKDSIRFVIQARTEKGKRDVEIELDNLLPQIVTKNKNAADLQVSITDGLSAFLLNSKNQFTEQVKYGLGNHTTMLKEVVITEKKKPIENSSNLNGAGNADQVIKSDQLTSCPTLAICLQGRLTGVIFRNNQAYSTRSMNTPMQIIVDGMYMDPDFLDQLNPGDVETVEVLRTIGTTAIYGSRGGAGVIVITTKRGGGGTSYLRYAPGIITYAPKGYYKARLFYDPRYDDPKTNTQITDLRTTIFWNPNIVTDKDGNASFDFFNADSKATYRIVVEGIDSDGNLGRQVYRYKVE